MDTRPKSIGVLVHLLELLRAESSTLDTFADAVHAYPEVALHVMHASNSILMEESDPVETLDDAIERLGLSGLLKTTSSFALCGLQPWSLPSYSGTGDIRMRWSLATAAVMEALAYEISEDSVHAFLVGLFHNIGELPIYRLLERIKPNARPPDPMDFGALAKWEREACRTDHSKAGAELLESWGFPGEITEPIHAHLHPMLSAQCRRFASMLHISRLVSRCLVHPDAWSMDCLAIPVRLLSICDVRKVDLAECLPAARSRFSRLTSFYLEDLAVSS